jgi:hypothetical protein
MPVNAIKAKSITTKAAKIVQKIAGAAEAGAFYIFEFPS